MPKRVASPVVLDFAFFTFLGEYYQENRRYIRKSYRDLTKRFLDFNDPSNSTCFLRQPQFEALEIYIFLKEYLNNAPVQDIFADWVDRKDKFSNRSLALQSVGQMNFLRELARDQYDPIFDRMRKNARVYSNYIYGLTMGTGKTILMATCIFYEFLLANKYPEDKLYCHNALVFAPDKTVLQSLREIETFDMGKVVPPEYVNFLSSHLQFHYLDETGVALSVIDKSRFNIIVSNTQKIILKRQYKEKTKTERLFGSGRPVYESNSVYEQASELYGFDEPDDEKTLTTNQRFEKLRRIEQLGIYVDEAHHAFGSALARDMGIQQSDTSLRRTIDELAASLEKSGTRVVACYNYTGTPYVGQEVLPEVVYAYGLQDAIDHQYLKKVEVNSFAHTVSSEFVQIVVDNFVSQNFFSRRHEGFLPKLAFFAPTINELQSDLRPAVEKALSKHNIPPSSILVNVGEEKLTTNDDIREFNKLDSPGSTKQFILLVNKGREGWNCRSLFGVALFREPKSKIFVLQATMRCLRSIGEAQETGQVYLSDANLLILEDELQQNFRISIEDLTSRNIDKQGYQIKLVPPPVKIKLKRVHRQFDMEEKAIREGYELELDTVDTEKYRIVHTKWDGLKPDAMRVEKELDHSYIRESRHYSKLTLVAEISRYLNKPCLEVEKILEDSKEGIEHILEVVNEFNEVLFDWIIPHLMKELYEITQRNEVEEYEAELVKPPDKGFFEVSASPSLVVTKADAKELASKSFHLDTYCFDSDPERNLFWLLLQEGKVKKLYFTGMLTHGQSDFYVQYIDPESHTVRSYYPDFLLQKEDGSYLIVEVKGDNKIDDPVVQAKQDFAQQMAVASGMTYQMIKGSDAVKGRYQSLFKDRSSSVSQNFL